MLKGLLLRLLFGKYCYIVRTVGKNGGIEAVFLSSQKASISFTNKCKKFGLRYLLTDMLELIRDDSPGRTYGYNGRTPMVMLQKIELTK